MKMDTRKFDLNGVHKEWFKDDSVSCEGEFKNGKRKGQ